MTIIRTAVSHTSDGECRCCESWRCAAQDTSSYSTAIPATVPTNMCTSSRGRNLCRRHRRRCPLLAIGTAAHLASAVVRIGLFTGAMAGARDLDALVADVRDAADQGFASVWAAQTFAF